MHLLGHSILKICVMNRLFLWKFSEICLWKGIHYISTLNKNKKQPIKVFTVHLIYFFERFRKARDSVPVAIGILEELYERLARLIDGFKVLSFYEELQRPQRVEIVLIDITIEFLNLWSNEKDEPLYCHRRGFQLNCWFKWSNRRQYISKLTVRPSQTASGIQFLRMTEDTKHNFSWQESFFGVALVFRTGDHHSCYIL